MDETITDAGVVGLGAFFRGGAVSPMAVLEAYLRRIARLNPTLNAFLQLDIAGAQLAAMASAARWAAGVPLSALDGVPMGIKANIAVAGLAWHGGIAAYADRVAAVDAACVARLRAAGAVIIGTLNMDEAALGATNDNAAFGRCHNPYRHGFTPGGSSGGAAAAVAAGLCAAALGTDTMGSVRIPAAYCGVFGHKPVHGLVGMAGIMPLSPRLDSVGVLARGAADVAAVLAVLAPIAPANATLRYALLDLGTAVTCADITAVVSLPAWDSTAVRRAALLVAEVDALAVHTAMLARHPEGFSAALTAMLRWAAALPAGKIASAHAVLAQAATTLRHAMAGFDALLLPAVPGPAFAFTCPVPVDQADFTVLANIAGLAATAFPMGMSENGLPLAAQVLSANDAVAIELARRLACVIPGPVAV
jgi:aspartyl-tRNA(Asn)/glutamyl-tRNA(Gln) amidotransferase subunit A